MTTVKGSVRELLGIPDFLRLWLVGGAAGAMRWLELLASGLFAWELTQSVLAVTVVVALRQLPQLALGAFAGAISEAVNRKTIMMLALLVPAVVSTVLATLAATDYLELWCLALGNLVAGILWSTDMATRRRMVGEVAGPRFIEPAIAVDTATHAATRTIGPLLGGILFEWLGMTGVFTLTAVVHFLGFFALAGLTYPQVTRRLNLAHITSDMAEALTFVRTHNTILLVYGVTVVTNVFAFSYSGLVAPIGSGEFDVSPALVGLLAAAEPMGALISGSLIAAGVVRMDQRMTFAGGAGLFMVALIVMAVSPSYWLAFIALVIGGFGSAGFSNTQTTLMLTEAPVAMRSRLMGLVTVGIGTGPLGVLAAGALSGWIGPRDALLAMASMGLVATITLVIGLRRRRIAP